LSRRTLTALAAALSLTLLVLGGSALSGAGADTTPQVDPASKIHARLADELAAGARSVRIIATTQSAPDAAIGAARQAGGSVTWRYTIIDGFAATVPAAAVDQLAARSDVTGIWRDEPVKAVTDVSTKAIEADKAWAAGFEGAGITVAVLDTGIDSTNPYLKPAIVSCVSTVGGVVSPECTDTDGHGTHVAGTVASRSTTYPGVARKASLAPVRVLHAAGTGFNSDIVAGMQWIANNKNKVSPPIRVATMSIGYSSPGCGDDTNPDAQAANALVNAGLVFTVAAGNSGHTKCTIDGASAASKVTTIAAVDDRATITQTDDVIASFSSGGSSKNNKPDVSFPGVNITSTFIGAGTLYATMSGTSMATPHAAGVAALLLSKESALTPAQVKSRITGNTVKNSNTGTTFNYVYGYGLGNACRTLLLTTCA
jgi:serine protease AprX